MTEKERIRKDIAHRLSVAETMLDASPNNEAWHLVYSELKSILLFIDESENENGTIIWHNADEEPQENTKIIWYATGDCIKMCTHTKDMVHGGMTKWAYAEELLNLKTQEPIEELSRLATSKAYDAYPISKTNMYNNEWNAKRVGYYQGYKQALKDKSIER